MFVESFNLSPFRVSMGGMIVNYSHKRSFIVSFQSRVGSDFVSKRDLHFFVIPDQLTDNRSQHAEGKDWTLDAVLRFGRSLGSSRSGSRRTMRACVGLACKLRLVHYRGKALSG